MSEDKPQTKKYHYVYEITNIYNGMRYIGARSCNCLPKDDIKYISSSKYLKKAIKEEGLDHFNKLILAIFPTREKALAYEIFLHNCFNVNKDPMFYNKAKQTSTRFECIMYGPDNPLYGKNRSEETKQKISKANLGRHRSTEEKKEIGRRRRKRIYSEEARQGMKNSQKGEKSPGYGKPLSQEHKNKIGKKSRQELRYIYITPVGEFTTAKKAGEVLHCSKNAILYRCRDEFEGYSRKLVENPYTEKREKIKELSEKGFRTSEIVKELGITRETVWVWKKKLGLLNQVKIKLTPAKVLEIRYLYDNGTPIKIIEKEFKLGKTQIRKIGKRQSWSNIPEELSPIDPNWQKNYCC